MSPSVLERVLQGDLSDNALQMVLHELAADPAWVVREAVDRGAEHVYVFTYQPTGVTYAFRGVRLSPILWRFGPCDAA